MVVLPSRNTSLGSRRPFLTILVLETFLQRLCLHLLSMDLKQAPKQQLNSSVWRSIPIERLWKAEL